MMPEKVWGSCTLWIMRTSEMEPKHYAVSTGPFKSFKSAHEWRMEYLKREFPEAYEKLVSERSPQDLLEIQYLCVDTPDAELEREIASQREELKLREQVTS